MRRAVICAAVVSVSAMGVRAASDDGRFDKVPESIVAALEATEVPALSAAAADKTGVIFADVAGVRVARGSSEVERDDAFHIGSCTKAMTATLVGMAVEEGKLRWDMTLSEALPEIAGEMHEQYKGVTIAQLLRHRSGMASFTKGAAAENSLMQGLEGDAAHDGSSAFRRSSAMRSTCLQAVANSVARSLSSRVRKAARIDALVLSRTAMMKGKPNLAT